MKTQEHRIETSINALFRRCPTLCGFTVRDAANLSRDGLARSHASRLFVTGVSVHPWSGLRAPGELCDEIAATLDELIDEYPEAGELLRERTFARVFH
jgi:hypothetical protein